MKLFKIGYVQVDISRTWFLGYENHKPRGWFAHLAICIVPPFALILHYEQAWERLRELINHRQSDAQGR